MANDIVHIVPAGKYQHLITLCDTAVRNLRRGGDTWIFSFELQQFEEGWNYRGLEMCSKCMEHEDLPLLILGAV